MREIRNVQPLKTPSQAFDPNDGLWRELVQATRMGDGSAAQEALDAGLHIYYVEDDTPEGLLIKEYPSGRRELVRFDITRTKPDEIVRVL